MLYKNRRTGVKKIYSLTPETVQGLYSAGIYTSSLYSAHNAPIPGLYEIPLEDPIQEVTEQLTGILDKFPGAAVAYAIDTRLYSSYTGPSVRVRRDLDNAERDFTPEEINNGDLVAWVGDINNGYVTTWYDQSGNANHATQTNALNQPKVVDEGVRLDLVYFDGFISYMNLPSVTLNQPFVVSLVIEPAKAYSFIWDSSTPSPASINSKDTIIDYTTFNTEIESNKVLSVNAGNELNSDVIEQGKVVYTIKVDTTTEIYRNNILIKTGNAGSNDISSAGLLGVDNALSNYYEGKILGMYMYNSSDITNINAYISSILALENITEENNYSVFVWDASTPSPSAI